MGFVSLVCTASLAFVGHRHCIQSLQGHCSYRCRTTCHEASDGVNKQPTALSSGNRAAAANSVLKSEAAKNYKKNDDSDSLGLTSAPERRSLLTNEKRHQIGLARGVAIARKQGKNTHYPGVCFHKKSGKWQVQFWHKGKRYYGGLHTSEDEAALAHDDFVRRHKMNRPLHFPMKGETSSLATSKLEEIPIEERQQLSAELSMRGAIRRGLYTRYPGVQFHSVRKRWQVNFRFKGKYYHGGWFETEKEAAVAHDEFVRRHKMKRPLHFPREGERSSFVDDNELDTTETG